MSPSTRLSLAVTAIAGVVILSGCSAPTDLPQSAVDLNCQDTVSFVVSVDSSNQAPGINSALAGVLDQAIAAGVAFNFIVADGTPAATIMGYRPRVTSASNPDAHRKDVSTAKKAILSMVSQMEADADGNDTLGAVSLAADAASSSGSECNTIVVLGAGNSDRGELDVTSPGVLHASGDEIAANLAARAALPHFGDVRTDVILAGIGYTAADSAQTPLRQADRDNLADIYTKVFYSAGASTVTDLRIPRTGASPDTVYTVNLIPVAATTRLEFCGTTVFDDASELGFLAGTATFRDPVAAREALSPLGIQIGTNRLEIIGTTADWGSHEYKFNLGQDRADAAAEAAISAGVPRDQITTGSVGSDFPDYNSSEWLPDGSLDPVLANTNRTVRITVVSEVLSASCHS